MLESVTAPAICCNPDKLMLTSSGLLPAPGAIAALYEGKGGKVTWIGKPYRDIYRSCAQAHRQAQARAVHRRQRRA